jgi:ketosteroid isomerase-like protein
MDPTISPATSPDALVATLCAATNAHDVDAIAACFAPGYRNETPVHPERGFVGSEQVRRNWTQILAAVPDLETVVLRTAVDGATVWSEWEHRGTRPDGSPHALRGVVIFGVDGHGRFDWARFYLEPVQVGSGGIDEAVRRQVLTGPPS